MGIKGKTLTVDNIMDELLYSDSKNLALLKETVMDYIASNGEDILKKVSFDNFPGHLVRDLLTAMAARETKSNKIDCIDMTRVNALRQKLHEKGLCLDGSREAMIALLK